MLSSPNDESPANVEAARMWREDERGFRRRVGRDVRASLGDWEILFCYVEIRRCGGVEVWLMGPRGGGVGGVLVEMIIKLYINLLWMWRKGKREETRGDGDEDFFFILLCSCARRVRYGTCTYTRHTYEAITYHTSVFSITNEMTIIKIITILTWHLSLSVEKNYFFFLLFFFSSLKIRIYYFYSTL